MNTELLDCGHARSTKRTYNGRPAWEFVLDFDGVRKICHACADARILDCGHTPSAHSHITTGYGTDSNGSRSCYACIAVQDRAQMIADGKACLYLSRDADGYKVGNWPGSLTFRAYGVKFSRNGGRFGAQRTDAYFIGTDGKEWHAVNRGDNQVARCRRLVGRKS